MFFVSYIVVSIRIRARTINICGDTGRKRAIGFGGNLHIQLADFKMDGKWARQKSPKDHSLSVEILEEGEDFLLVACKHGVKNLQGILLDVNKNGLPYGVKPPDWYNTSCPGTETDQPPPRDDPYHTISTRLTYFQNNVTVLPPATQPAARPRPRPKGARSAVRLRPRQVLCSNCRSICNEKSETVQPSKRQRELEPAAPAVGAGDENASPAAAAAGTEKRSSPPVAQPPPAIKLPRIPIVRLSARQLRSTASSNSNSSSSSSSISSFSSSSAACVKPSTTFSAALPAAAAPSPPSPPLQSSVAPICTTVTAPTSTRTGKLTVSPIKIVGNNVKKCDTNGRKCDTTGAKRSEPSVKKECTADQNCGDSDKPKLQKIKICGGAIVPASSASVDVLPPAAAASATVLSPATAAEVPAGLRRTGLRKRRLAAGSMEDLWDESVFGDGRHPSSSDQEDAALTPILKISFGGREGAGTVLKIPARCRLRQDSVSSAAESERAPTAPASRATASTKAARRALKKARKDVQRKLVGSPRTSPAYTWDGRSPGYPRQSPIYPQMSPAYYRVSPAHPGPAALLPVPAALSQLQQPPAAGRKKRHKHKLKHKRRRRDQGSGTAAPSPSEVRPQPPVEMREQCLSQKLSISLRRIRASEYAAGAPPPPTPAPAADAGRAVSSAVVPASAPATSCRLSDGRLMHVGDVVWGKIHGSPWWPGKVTGLCESSAAQEAYVSWYGSTTSSVMRCSQLLPFLETFESRVNRKRRGPYREAIRQATLEAQLSVSSATSPPPPPPPPPGPAQSPLALASPPREVDVAS